MFSCFRPLLEQDHVGDKKSDADGNEAKSAAEKAQIAVEETRQSKRDDDEQAEVCARHAIGPDSARDQFHAEKERVNIEDHGSGQGIWTIVFAFADFSPA